MKKIFLDDLPRWEHGATKGKICWNRCEGLKVKFVYDDVEGEVEIIKFISESYKLELLHNGNKKIIYTNDLINCRIASLIGKRTDKYKYNKNEILDHVKYGKILILDQIRLDSGKYGTKGYKYRCLVCGNIDVSTETGIASKQKGCNVCSGKKVLRGVNDLWTTHPQIASLLKNKEYGYIVNSCSHKKLEFLCPDCGHLSIKIIHNVTKRGFACTGCSDGISYPEKFIAQLLNQLDIAYEKEKEFEWAKGKFYDFYIPSLSVIIEAHGLQHYKQSFKNFDKRRSLSEEKENDLLKNKLAIKNKIENYIVVDCSISELVFIKNNLLSSRLSTIFNLNDIDWLSCHEFACRSLVKAACDLWNAGMTSPYEIGKKLKIGHVAIQRYLNQGNDLGICNYNPKENHLSTLRRNHIKRKRMIVQLSLSGDFIREWDSARDAYVSLSIQETTIIKVCKRRGKSAGGFKWMYKEDFDKVVVY